MTVATSRALVPERMSLELSFDTAPAVGPDVFIDVFHRFIQTGRIGGDLGDLLIDVHDYTHVDRGPGVMLVAFAGHYRIAQRRGRPSLVYARKRALTGDWSARLGTVFGAAFCAAQALAEEPALDVRWDTGELLLRVDDRLGAPNDAGTARALVPLLRSACAPILGPTGVTWVEDSRAPFAVRLVPAAPPAVAEVLGRLSPGQG